MPTPIFERLRPFFPEEMPNSEVNREINNFEREVFNDHPEWLYWPDGMTKEQYEAAESMLHELLYLLFCEKLRRKAQ